MRQRRETASGAALAEGVIAGDRRALAKAITLIESARPEDVADAEALFQRILPKTGGAIRLGLSGPPGAGKSTFIEAFGRYLTGQGLTVAVLAIDPSSRRSGGSILGDKTRMEQLARDPKAFIRPSPSGGSLGGVARRTHETVLLVEAAGFDVVIVETVGVGQSETAVADMVDMFVLLASPGAGDDLQGIKRGIMELADLVVVNKADGDLLPAARRAASDIQSALHLMRPKTPYWTAEIALASALKGEGLPAIWEAIGRYREAMDKSGALAALRNEQRLSWFRSELHEGLDGALAARAGEAVAKAEAEVKAGRLTPATAARQLLEAVFGKM
ncbi:MAG: methylmalonyl Co-A mutase-associated GTPase MeaB [Alphaproteobacteria bacterium]|nr:methylmalonyl Co-A mutase-associated GTPase MeaB [Alphaproteobacteria bacterium]